MISALGVYLHQLWMMWLGSGVLGGIGLGLGYISPVSTLIKWFPDRRGMATGMAIMGFGGGALIGSPLADMLMNRFGDGVAARGVWQTLLVMAAIYAVFMLGGAFGYRVPPARIGRRTAGAAGAARRHDHDPQRAPARRAQDAAVLADLVRADAQRVGRDRRAGGRVADAAVRVRRHADRAARRAPRRSIRTRRGRSRPSPPAFVGLLSLFNIGGRFFWASVSDKIGRKLTYATFFVLGVRALCRLALGGADRQRRAVRARSCA